MERHKHLLATLGAVILMVLCGSLCVGGGEAWAYYSFDFTYSGDSLRACHINEEVQFRSLIKNTGTEADTYLIVRYEYPSTPQDWWARMCAGGICYDSTRDSVNVYMEPNEEGEVLLDAMPRSVGQGMWRITVQSKSSPGLSRSLNFYLTCRPTPVTNEWGLIILTLLIVASGMYLIFIRYRTVRQT